MNEQQLDINILIGEYDQRLAELQRENLMLKAMLKQAQESQEA